MVKMHILRETRPNNWLIKTNEVTDAITCGNKFVIIISFSFLYVYSKVFMASYAGMEECENTHIY